MTHGEYVEIAGLIERAWPKRGWPLGTVAAGEEILLDLDYLAVRSAVVELAKEGSPFAPVPGQVYRATVGEPEWVPDW